MRRRALIGALVAALSGAGCGVGPPPPSKAPLYTPAPQPVIPSRTAAVRPAPLADGIYWATLTVTGQRFHLSITEVSFAECVAADGSAPGSMPDRGSVPEGGSVPDRGSAPKSAPPPRATACPVTLDGAAVDLAAEPANVRHVTVVAADGVNFATSATELLELAAGRPTAASSAAGFHYLDGPFLVTVSSGAVIELHQARVATSL